VGFVAVWRVESPLQIRAPFPQSPRQGADCVGCGWRGHRFAFKDVFGELPKGRIIYSIREPFSVEDYIECEGFEGRSEEITIRDNHVRQTEGQLVRGPKTRVL